jgi:virginiamycin B lyase
VAEVLRRLRACTGNEVVAVSNQLGGFSDGIVTGPDGNVWITNNASNEIDRIVPNGSSTAYATVGTTPRNILVGPDGKLWYTEPGSNSIGSITMSGTVAEYGSAYGINASAAPLDIVLGPDGNIWFTEIGSNSIGKIVL